MNAYVPVVRVDSVQVYRDAASTTLYAYGGPGRSYWLNLGLAPAEVALTDLRIVLQATGALSHHAAQAWQRRVPPPAAAPPAPEGPDGA